MEEKYFEIHTYSPYCGEESYHYVVVNNEMDIEAIAISYCEEDAYDWYDDQAEDEYGDEFYLNCGYDLRELTKEEHERVR